jgi:beta-galactosidase
MSSFAYRNGRYYRDGKPFYFVSAEYQYYRDKRANWGPRLDQLKAGHCNVISFYIPWRHHLQHDPRTGAISYDFTGATLDSRDLTTFLNLCRDRGLYMLAKPGPFVHSELNIGGLPDLASPSFNPEIEPVRLCNQQPLYWEHDHTQLPSPNDVVFDKLASDWLRAVAQVLAPHVGEGGRVIGIQLLDETLYCTSNDPPWNFGYDAPDMRHYHRLLKDKYRTIANYNTLHGTAYPAFAFVPAPMLEPSRPVAATRPELLTYMDWGEFQWRIRREFYARYKKTLGVNLPHLTNFAGLTPPIVGNAPSDHEVAVKPLPPAYGKLYTEWWFAQNRVDQDLDVYEYGMISWLGVAAYNISDGSSEPGELGDNDVFNRYLNTARRRRGINIEENWGFATLYHPLSKYPMIPFFQTLASVAGGCTGYVIFTGLNHSYWLDDLDRSSRKQYRLYPSHAPIGEHGETGEMYAAMSLINEWFAREGEGFLRAELDFDVCFLIYPDYASISSWTPSATEWALPHAIPRVGADVIEPAARICNGNGVNYEFAELPALSVDELLARKTVAFYSGFFLAKAEQRKLVEFVKRGGKLIISGELPAFDEKMKPCAVLANFIRRKPDGVVYSAGNIFGDEGAFLDSLNKAGWQKRVSYSDLLRAFVYRHEDDFYVFFFNFDRAGAHDKFVEFYGRRLELTVGSKTCGVVHVRGERIVSYVVKGVNEFEQVTADVRLKLGAQDIEFAGDKAEFDM